MNEAEPIRILSLGAGVESSTVALMSARGELPPIDAAIFADTQCEPDEVYEWLNWLETQLPFPIHRVTKGNLMKDSLVLHTSKKTGMKYLLSLIPMFVLKKVGGIGMLLRKCTRDYKIVPIVRKLRELLGIGTVMKFHIQKRLGLNPQPLIIQIIGISFDELERMKTAKEPWIKNEYPLVDKRIKREQCENWLLANYGKVAAKSACICCPYMSDARRKKQKEERPAEFAQVVQWEQQLQQLQCDKRQVGTWYVHRSCLPLDQVRFRPDPEKADQLSLFGNECEGMCGL